MHLASNFIATFSDSFSGDIILDTRIQSSAQNNDPSTLPQHHQQQTGGHTPHDQPEISTVFPKPPSIPQTFASAHSSYVDVSTSFPETTIDAHAPGWTVFSNLYMSNGTLYVVSSQPPSSFPDIRLITSTGLPAENTPENIAARMPTAQDLAFITPERALARWGPVSTSTSSPSLTQNRVWSVQGNTFLFNDPSQFLDHYYHFCAELLLGAWAFWSGANNAKVDASSPSISSAPPVHRAIFAHAEAEGWRDRPGMNAYFLRSAFPSLTVETQWDWEDRIIATSSTGVHARAWHFDKVLFSDRSAAFRGEYCGLQVHRTAGEAYLSMFRDGKLAKLWWEPVRRAVLNFAGVPKDVQDIGIKVEADAKNKVKKPTLDDKRPFKSTTSGTVGQDVVITYISRQGVRRHLIDQDHENLVFALEELCAIKGWELNIVQAERLSKEDQLALVAKTTILLGVHGNGLSHLIMMSPTPISTVIEIFYPRGFAHDYEWSSRALGMKHFAIQNDTYYTHPRLPWVDYPEGFQGTQIPVQASLIIQIIQDRVAGRLPNTDFTAEIQRFNYDQQ
ncbi:hypothetical protein NLI96_g3374 [Meripilus lineatus]|uniref:Glycosyltransferase 61 catalytic domain-containing protein n=1 Tax=Meripilus lineatus TaxID=2056292 RepID=A0AAD5YJ49_9APHY|nr:hypothetical protein NLI96_g3374 [Physisporinus lineatus]